MPPNDGSVYCWGRGANGELGIGPLTDTCTVSGSKYHCSSSPQKVMLGGATALGLGTLHTCAAAGGQVYCWGLDSYGQYGDGTTSGQATPRAIAPRAGATLLAGGGYDTCSLAGGQVACSGANLAGEVGEGATGQQPTATPVLSSAVSLGLGEYTSCAVDDQGQARCWGRNSYRQIDPSLQNKPSPTVVTWATGVTQVVAGRDHVCAVHTDHTATCWASDVYGQLGDGMTTANPQAPVAVMVANVVQLSAGLYHTCARDQAGTVWCWGQGYQATPAAVALARPAIEITSGGSHDCAITDDQQVWCWGSEDFGELGNGVAAETRQPQPQLAAICP